MRSCPGERLLLGIEKPIDDDGIALSHISPTRACCFAIDHARSTVYGYTFRISKENFAAIGNFLWVDSAMPFAQPCAVPRGMLARTFPMPVNGDACQG